MSRTAPPGPVLIRTAFVWLLASVALLSLFRYPFTPDSYAYVAAAESVAERGDLTVPFAPSYVPSLPVPYTAWPPGYPLLIALFAAAGPGTWSAARLLALAGVWLAALVFWRSSRERPGAAYAVLLVVASAPLAAVGATAWSEGPFLLCVFLVWHFADRCCRAPAPRAFDLLAVLVFCAAASLLRYSGLFLLPTLLWLCWRRRLWLHRLAGTAGVLLAAVPIGLWFLRNARLPAGWRGAVPHAPAWWRAPAEFLRAGGELSFLPAGVPPALQAAGGALLAALIAVALWRHRQNETSPGTREADWVFGGAFLVFALLVRGLGLSGDLTPRLVWPLLPFVALRVAPVLARARTRLAAPVVGAYLAAQSFAVVALVRADPSPEARLSAAALPEGLCSEGALLANRGWTVWQRTGRPVYYAPMRQHDQDLLGPDSLPAWAARRSVRYLVWQDVGGDNAEASIYGSLPVRLAAGDAPARSVFREGPVTVYEIQAEH